ncbi:hypothetical protein [Bradyrhizobium sp. OK095]|uniref:hypothetical protein n=1 Tax=Bradyrhizobium sp. OK095 TaxID=1882760 RepID=UPI0008D28294|nr:hypothetical protein [Bradyrhizobium sp. OK095]SEN66780.1 hypothetical protein SAMN05443254_11020 [Bradyrhizobium sp. OK095]
MSGYGVSTSEKDPMKFAIAIQSLFNGRSNAAGSTSLNTGTDTLTVVSAQNCAAQCAVLLFPKNAAAASELAAGTCYVSAVGKQQFTITHGASAAARSFFYVCIG